MMRAQGIFEVFLRGFAGRLDVTGWQRTQIVGGSAGLPHALPGSIDLRAFDVDRRQRGHTQLPIESPAPEGQLRQWLCRKLGTFRRARIGIDTQGPKGRVRMPQHHFPCLGAVFANALCSQRGRPPLVVPVVRCSRQFLPHTRSQWAMSCFWIVLRHGQVG